jgi:hypothetical protein
VALRRRKRADLPPMAEGDVYARSYGERSDEVSNVKPVPREETEAEQAAKRLTDRDLRDAFRARLDRREEP